MEQKNLIIGFEFNPKESQICYFDRMAKDAVSAEVKVGSSQYTFPTVLSKSLGKNEPNCGSSVRCVAPWVNEDTSYTFTEEGPEIKVYTSINSRFIIEDFICKLQILYSV